MYILIDLRNQPAAVEAWLGSLAPGPGPRSIQRFTAIGYAALDVTPAEFNDARERKFGIEPVGELRAPHTIVTGQPVRAVDFMKAAPHLWNLDQIGCAALRATGKNVKVGHIDTGIESDHPVLEGHPAKFRTFRQNGDVVSIKKPSKAFDGADHGTSTASLICGKPLGVAPEVQLYSAALLGRPWTDAMLVAAFDWMIEEGVRVVWMGVERPAEFCDLHEDEMKRLIAAKIVPVTAIGNKGRGKSSTPGNTRYSLSTGAVCKGNRSPTMWDGSGSGVHPKDEQLRPDLVAPGHDVYVATCFHGPTTVEHQVATKVGTSLAGPHVAGLAALCLELCPSITTEELMRVLRKACKIYQLDPNHANKGVPWGESIKKELGC